MKNSKINIKKILLIIPAYNESENILSVYKNIVQYNNKNKQNYDILVINDGSTDNTEEILCDNNINHIKLIHNLRIGGAVQTGYKFALENNYDIAVQFDGDGQHDVKYVKNIIEPIINKKANMVIGSRFIDSNTSKFKSSASRRAGIKIISKVIKIKTGKKIYDTTSGFRAVDSNIMKIFSESYPREYPEPISTVNILNNNLIVKEEPVAMHERIGGTSSIKSWKTIYYMINVILSILLTKGRNK